MSFDVSAEKYGRFMGRYSEQLAVEFADVAGLAPGRRVLDVGSGPGALTAQLVDRVGADAVAAADPSPLFVEAARSRFPDVDVRLAPAEALPFGDDTFDAALAQLVVQFMADPVAGLREMGRVTRPGGVVAACVWDMSGGPSPLSTFWSAVRDLDGDVAGESGLAGVRDGQLVDLAGDAGLVGAEQSVLTVSVRYETFEEWWEPYTFGVGPAGDHVARLGEPQRATLRDRCAELLGPAPFDVVAQAWCMRSTVAT
ncbi:SAM-dependent methyltransferase [Marmoricola sp. URHA0025 HA25]